MKDVSLIIKQKYVHLKKLKDCTHVDADTDTDADRCRRHQRIDKTSFPGHRLGELKMKKRKKLRLANSLVYPAFLVIYMKNHGTDMHYFQIF